MDTTHEKSLIEALGKAKTGGDILKTGVTPEEIAHLTASGKIPYWERDRIRQILSVDENGFWYPRAKTLGGVDTKNPHSLLK
jgi:hypothetical protein